MKTTIVFDTEYLADQEQRQRIEEAPGFELAYQLRLLAQQCEKTGDLPTPQELALDEDGCPVVGEVIAGEGCAQHTPVDASEFAALVGDLNLFHQAYRAQDAVIAAMRNDTHGNYRDGLLLALEALTERLLDRADFLDNQVLGLGGRSFDEF